MTDELRYPLLLTPTLHVKVWGGRRLADHLHKALPTDDPYGESWELHDTAVIANGALAGRTLGDLLGAYGTALVGEGNDPAQGFPLLAKLLDAADWLSVQVHPDDAQAAELEGQPRGKTEAWIMLATTPDAQLVIGVKPGTSRGAMAEAIRGGTLEPLLVTQKVVPGDVMYIPAGTVHAIGPGVLLYEIQQSSNTTYRLYDWNRMGLDGSPRELHIDKGVRVSNVESLPQIAHHPAAPGTVTLVQGPFFETQRHTLAGDALALDTGGRRFHALTCIDGTLTLTTDAADALALTTGSTALIPAALGRYQLSGVGVALRSYQTD